MRDCPVCGADASCCSQYTADYLRCNKCLVVYYNEQPRVVELDVCYRGKTWFKRFRRSILAPFRKMWTQSKLKVRRERANAMLARMRSRVGDGPVEFFDIGCHKGFLLEAAMGLGWRVSGVEYSSEQITPFLNTYPQLKSSVLSGDFLTVASSFSDGKFDLICAIDVIEHFEHPRECFYQIARLLKPGSVFVIQTPSVDSEDAKGQGAAWCGLKPVEHLQLFSTQGLQILARETGFAEVHYEEPFESPQSNVVAVLRRGK